MNLVRHGNMWVVEGPEKHRARVFYASLDGSRLVYEPARVEERPQSSRQFDAVKPTLRRGFFIN